MVGHPVPGWEACPTIRARTSSHPSRTSSASPPTCNASPCGAATCGTSLRAATPTNACGGVPEPGRRRTPAPAADRNRRRLPGRRRPSGNAELHGAAVGCVGLRDGPRLRRPRGRRRRALGAAGPPGADAGCHHRIRLVPPTARHRMAAAARRHDGATRGGPHRRRVAPRRRVHVVAEVTTPADEQRFDTAGDVTYTWLHGTGNGVGPSALATAAAGTTFRTVRATCGSPARPDSHARYAGGCATISAGPPSATTSSLLARRQGGVDGALRAGARQIESAQIAALESGGDFDSVRDAVDAAMDDAGL